MKKAILLIIFTVILTSIILSSSVSAQPSSERFVPNRLLVKFYDNISEEQKQGLLEQNKAAATDKISQIKVLIITVPDNTINNVERALKNNPNVEYVERDWILEPTAIPNDPELSKQWHLSKIDAFGAWDSTHGSNVPIAILDTGVNLLHPDLTSKLQKGWNFYDNNSDYSDICGHGTIVAGTAAAITDNVIGVAGVAWNNPIIPIKITDPSCYGYYSSMAKGITYAADNGAKVANISFQIFNGQTLSDAAKYMNSKGGVVVAAAGNTGILENYADNPYIISVGATDYKDNIASFSSFGPYVDFSAPGVSVYTTCVCKVVTFDSSGAKQTSTSYYMYASGTSFASPIVAGAAALVLSANPSATPDQVYNALKASAVDLGTSGRDDHYGWGRINVNSAIDSTANLTPVTDTVPPTVYITNPSSGDIVSGKKVISGYASDNYGISKVEIFIDGTLKTTLTGSTYQYNWNTRSLSPGPHTILVKAIDTNGNFADTKILVTRK